MSRRRRRAMKHAAEYLAQMPDRMIEEGVASEWYVYFQVADHDESAGYVQRHGGRLMAEAEEIAGFGRMVVARDPQGADFCIVEPETGIARTGDGPGRAIRRRIANSRPSTCQNRHHLGDGLLHALVEFVAFRWHGERAQLDPPVACDAVEGARPGAGSRRPEPGFLFLLRILPSQVLAAVANPVPLLSHRSPSSCGVLRSASACDALCPTADRSPPIPRPGSSLWRGTG